MSGVISLRSFIFLVRPFYLASIFHFRCRLRINVSWETVLLFEQGYLCDSFFYYYFLFLQTVKLMFLPMKVRRQRQRRWLPRQQVAVCCYSSSPSRSSSSLKRNWVWTTTTKKTFSFLENLLSFVRNKNVMSELYFLGREICKSKYKFRKFPPICMGSINTVILYILTLYRPVTILYDARRILRFRKPLSTSIFVCMHVL